MSTLFDTEPSPDAAVPAPVAPAGGTVKCGGCGGAILARVALQVRIDPGDSLTGRIGHSCKQPACVRAVAQDLAAPWAI